MVKSVCVLSSASETDVGSLLSRLLSSVCRFNSSSSVGCNHLVICALLGANQIS